MENNNVTLFPNLTHAVVAGITGFKLCTYLVALEGWRRGLTLKWYKDETDLCKFNTLNSSTHGKFFSLSSDHNIHYFFRSRGDKVSNEALAIGRDKEKTKDLLRKEGVPVPLGKVFDIANQKDMIKYAESIDFPVIIKPLKGSMGRGVYTNINNKGQLIDTLENARTTYKYKDYILEKHYSGKEYRVYVVGDKVIGATNRIPANVTGDGKSSVKILIDKKNIERKKNPYLAPKPIKIDYEIRYSLKKLGYDENSIPLNGETVYLREKSNLSSGGDPIEATDELSKEVKRIAVDALRAIPSMPHAGVDIIVNPEASEKGVVLEINSVAEIGFHSFPLKGKAKDVPGAIIDYYFPETIGQEKSDFYFDYNSILEPLKTWTVEEITVTKPPIGDIHGKKYVISGKVNDVGYLAWIKMQALKRNLLGYAKKSGENQVEVMVVSTDKNEVNKFMVLCKKGSKKSRVDKVEEKQIELNSGQPLKIGFKIIL